MEKIEIERELLESLYWGNEYSYEKIAETFNCSVSAIVRRIHKYNIFRRRSKNVENWVICDWCGKSFIKPIGATKRHHDLCSQECRNSWHSKFMKELNSHIWRDGEKRCPKCEIFKPLSEFYRGYSQPSGVTTYCKGCTKKKNYARKRKRTRSILGTHGEYRRNAKVRNLEFELTANDVGTFIHADCYYCGGFPNEVNGIDRIDNSKGYTLDNCVPCCKQCNYIKKDMSQDEFADFILSTYDWAKQFKGD